MALPQKSVTPELLQKLRSLGTKTESPSPQVTLPSTSKSGILIKKRTPVVGERVQKRTLSEQRRRDTSLTILNVQARRPHLPTLQVESDSTRLLPTISYRQFRNEHQQRNNSTSPSKRRYADHSIGGEDYNPAAAIKMYQRRVIRFSARSKLIVHKYCPPFQIPDKPRSPMVRKKQVVERVAEGGKSAEDHTKHKVISAEVEEPVALTFGEKLIKVQRAFNEAFAD